MKLINLPKQMYRDLRSPFSLLMTGFIGASASCCVQAAPITVDDVIAVDFASNGGNAINYNIFDSNTTITAGNVKLWNGGDVVDGVSLSFSGSDGFNNAGEYDGWSGASADPYYVDDANDAAYSISSNSPLILTFAGLDDSLAYNLRVYSFYNHTNASRNNRTEEFEVTDGIGTVSSGAITRLSRWNASSLEDGGTVFSDLSTDGSGNIVLTVTGVNFDNPFINAAVLTVIPEPSISALVLALVCLPAVLIRRRR